MSWTKIRVHKFTRELHPNDHENGLPQPSDTADDEEKYEYFIVRQNNDGEWVGQNGIVNNWLAQREPYAFDAKEAQEETNKPNKSESKRKKRVLPFLQ